ncbi:MAG: ABC transporter permease [Candidatus Acidiferrales bacterium]
MNWLHQIVFRLRAVLGKRKRDRVLDEELQTHLALLVEQNVARGMSLEAARREAKLSLGGADQIKESVHDHRGLPFLETFIQDLRFALRMLRKSPGFTAVAVLTLALGIGANTAIFSLINAVLLRTLPAAHPHELVLFSETPMGGANSGEQTGHWMFFSNDNYTYFRDHSESFKEMCAFQSGWTNLNLRLVGTSARPEVAHGRVVSGNFFSLLGLNPSAGRLFTSQDDQLGAPPTVVLSYLYWIRRFHQDSSVIGNPAEISGATYTIIGIAPPGFFDIKYDRTDLWIPLAFQPQVMSTESYANDPQEYWLNIMARLKPGVTLRKAQAVVNNQLKQILATQAHPETVQQIANSYITLAPGAYGISYIRITYEEAIQVLAGIVAIVLLIACANVANLLLSRSSARAQEISIRLSLGATRARLIRQLLTESILLAALGGAFGILGARWGVELLASMVTGSSSIVKSSVNARVLLFTAVVSLLAGILFGLVPALRSSRADLATQSKGSAGSRLRFGFANGLVVFQIAACLVLLIGAGLFLRTLQKLADQVLGFDEDHIVVARIDPWRAGYSPAQTPALYQALIDRAEAIPGVVSATVSYTEPLSGSSWTSNFSIEGAPSGSWRDRIVHKELVGPHYFETEGIPIILGRDIGPQDRPSGLLVTVINETMAKKFFPGANPIGRRFSLGAPFNDKEAMTIVGVAADARFYSLRDPVPPMEFCAAFTVPDDSSHSASYAQAVEVRVSGNPRGIATEIRTALSQVAANLPVTDVFLLDKRVGEALQQNRSAAELSSAFGTLALLLACIGIYGTMSYRVSRRTHEIGIRLALGAQPSDVLWLIARECLILLAVGIFFGVPIALASTKIIAAQLFGVRATDPWIFAGVAILLTLVALLACYIPARRAMKVDPMVALRYE